MFKIATGAALVVAVLAAAPAHADQNFYGVLDVNLSVSKPSRPDNLVSRLGKADRQVSVEPGRMTASYIGFSASEKINDDLTASMVIEARAGLDTGAANTTNFWGRNAKVGVASETYGSLSLGRIQTVFFDSLTAFSPFGEGVVGPSVGLLAGGAATVIPMRDQFSLDGATLDEVNRATDAILAREWSNSVVYQTPDFDGLSAAFQIGLKEGDPNGGNHALAVRLDADELQAGFAYQSVKADLPAVSATSNNRWVAGISYDFSVLTAYAQVGQDKFELYNGSIRSNFMQFGAKVPVSAKGVVLASFGRIKNKPLASTATALTVVYDHSFSLRTDAYATVSLEKFEFVGDEGDLGTLFTLGVRHRF